MLAVQSAIPRRLLQLNRNRNREHSEDLIQRHLDQKRRILKKENSPQMCDMQQTFRLLINRLPGQQHNKLKDKEDQR